jgi:hypothetical protein
MKLKKGYFIQTITILCVVSICNVLCEEKFKIPNYYYFNEVGDEYIYKVSTEGEIATKSSLLQKFSMEKVNMKLRHIRALTE